jgi:hypothetical protein
MIAFQAHPAYLPLVPPSGVTGADFSALPAIFDKAELAKMKADSTPVSPSLPAPDTLLVGDYRRNIGIEADTVLTFEAGEDVAFRATVGEVLSLPTLKADVERLTGEKGELVGLISQMHRPLMQIAHLANVNDETRKMIVHIGNLCADALSLAEVGKQGS